MRCKQGDRAFIIKAVNPVNVMRIVNVAEYIGKFGANETFEYRGEHYRVPISDHYWWVQTPPGSGGLETGAGETSRANLPDSWLKPFPPDLLDGDPEGESLDLNQDHEQTA